jgi:TolB-like protein
MVITQQSSCCLKQKLSRSILVSICALVLVSVWLSLPIRLAAQQSGAVPLTQGVADLASQLAKSIPQGQTMTIAVTDFPQKKQICGLGTFVAERLSTLMSRQTQCRLIERHRLDQVLQELKFSMSELVDPAKARRLGQMLGVQGLVVGTMTDLGTTFDVDARIIDIQTDVSLPGASASIVKDDTIRILSADCGGSASSPAVPGSGVPTTTQLFQPNPPAQTSLGRVVVRDFAFEVNWCRMRETTVTCHVMITNIGTDRELWFAGHNWNSPRPVRLIDNSGNEYLARKVQIGNQANDQGGDVHGVLASGVPMAGAAVFENVSPTANSSTLLEFPCVTNGSPQFVVQLRNIPIVRQ